MSLHIRDAFRVLLHGLPKPEVREVPVFVHGEKAELFLLCHSFWSSYPTVDQESAPAWHGTVHRSCAEAFAAAGGSDKAVVTRIDALKYEGKYYYSKSVPREIKLSGKPKKAKGARK